MALSCILVMCARGKRTSDKSSFSFFSHLITHSASESSPLSPCTCMCTHVFMHIQVHHVLTYSFTLPVPVEIFLAFSIPIGCYLGKGENEIYSSADAWLLRTKESRIIFQHLRFSAASRIHQLLLLNGS